MKIKMLKPHKTENGRIIGANQIFNVREVSIPFSLGFNYQVTGGPFIGEMIPPICALKLKECAQPQPTKQQYDELKEMSEAALGELKQMTEARNGLQGNVLKLQHELDLCRSIVKDIIKAVAPYKKNGEDTLDVVLRLVAEFEELRVKELRSRIINIVDCSADTGDAADTLLVLINEVRRSAVS